MISNQISSIQSEFRIYVVEKGFSSEYGLRKRTSIAEIGKEIIFDPSVLDTYHYDGWQPVHYDLLVVCAAVEYADRRYSRRATQWSRRFFITVPVQELERWQRPEVQASISSTLRLLTGDDWDFSFVKTGGPSAKIDRQRSLPFGNNKQFAIAYSDGLDSRCVSGIYDSANNAIRVRISKNKDKIRRGERPFDRIPFEVKKSSKESGVRSRGFKFAAITAIAAHLSEVRRIIVTESGQGALGPVLIPLHNVYADYRNYPTFFRKMELFVKELLGSEIAYEQPRLWHTKGQTISDFLTQPRIKPEEVINTRSCWQQRWNIRINGKLRQCGLCAACLLRRMSMHAVRIDEPDDTYTFEDLTSSNYGDYVSKNKIVRSSEMVEYGSAGVRHLQQLADLSRQPDAVLRPYIFEIARATELSENVTRDNLRKLLMHHADEWRYFISDLGKESFVYKWAQEGRAL